MKTNGLVLCVEDLRLAEHRRLPLSASASKKNEARMAEKRRNSGLGGGGWERRWVGLGEISPQDLGLIYGFTQTNPPPPPTQKGGQGIEECE